jgi:hypothetical protein
MIKRISNLYNFPPKENRTLFPPNIIKMKPHPQPKNRSMEAKHDSDEEFWKDVEKTENKIIENKILVNSSSMHEE